MGDSSNSSEQSDKCWNAKKIFGVGFIFVAVTRLSILILRDSVWRYQRADRFDDMMSRNDLR
jgi:hypothetical protein